MIESTPNQTPLKYVFWPIPQIKYSRKLILFSIILYLQHGCNNPSPTQDKGLMPGETSHCYYTNYCILWMIWDFGFLLLHSDICSESKNKTLNKLAVCKLPVTFHTCHVVTECSLTCRVAALVVLHLHQLHLLSLSLVCCLRVRRVK